MTDCAEDHDAPEVPVSLFDYSVENHFKAMDTISKLCGEEAEASASQESEIERLSPTIMFLREWRQYKYDPRIIKFASEVDSPQGKIVVNGINLPQFSTATVPKEGLSGTATSSKSRKDFVLYVGGFVWALDWCPQVHQRSDFQINSEFIAIAAHPPESSYHKIGVPLIGRGIVQIWCLLNNSMDEEDVPPSMEKQKGRSKKDGSAKEKANNPKRPRGRPRKMQIIKSIDGLECKNERAQLVDVQCPEYSTKLLATDGLSMNSYKHVAQEGISEQEKSFNKVMAPCNSYCETSSRRPRGRPRKKPRVECLDGVNLDNKFARDSVMDQSKPKRPRGRPRKKPRGRPRNVLGIESVDGWNCQNVYIQPLAAQFPEDSSNLLAIDGLSMNDYKHAAQEGTNEHEESFNEGVAPGNLCGSTLETSALRLGEKPIKPIVESLDGIDPDNKSAQPLADPLPENSSELLATNGLSVNSQEDTAEEGTRKQEKGFNQDMAPHNLAFETSIWRLRGRPRKEQIVESLNGADSKKKFAQPPTVQVPENSLELLTGDEFSINSQKVVGQEDSNKQEKGFNQGMTPGSLVLKNLALRRRLKRKMAVPNYNDDSSLSLLAQNKGKESSIINHQTHYSSEENPMASGDDMSKNGPSKVSSTSDSIPKEVALPRIVLCLAHNGKVAWDVKWRPSCMYDLECKHRMGYLAVLLGNGSLEVWEVPSLHAIKVIYSTSQKGDTDPRFVKLEPVFRCSKLKYGDRQSIPLTVEWSTFSPHDFILAGCHDGTVALWKFTASDPSKDSRPLRRFSADTAPIRALAWAPVESDPESANVIVTAGNGGIKFWDIRNQFRPLSEINPARRVIYSVDWLSYPRCIILSLDDGTLRIISIMKISNDVAVTGKPFTGTQQPGLNYIYCSPFPIWSVQVSRTTGVVAYCGAGGTVLRFQLTNKAVEKDSSRYRAPHFLCGSLTEEDSVLTVNSPLSNTPFAMKKSSNQFGDASRSIRGISELNEAKRSNNKKTKHQTSDDQLLDVDDDDDDPVVELVSETTKAASKRKQTGKSTCDSKSKSKQDEAQVKNTELYIKNEEEGAKEIDVFPPKVVAMHKVRWNMNKGSERWLCYGGAAGIVRCQKIGMN